MIHLFPIHQRTMFQETIQRYEHVQEIRIRVGKPIIILGEGKEWYLRKDGSWTSNCSEKVLIGKKELVDDLIQYICKNSIYAYADEIGQGYITVVGGHRIGIVGQVVLSKEGNIKTIKYFSSINIRIAHEIKGVATAILPYIYERGKVCNTLIISPPGCGKTTMLRDIIRQVSNGNEYGAGMQVSVVDERSELGSSYQGVPQNDLGMRTDIIDACPKAEGMMLLLRSMGPEVIAVDELGSMEDVKAVEVALQSGCVILASVHGNGIEELKEKPYLNKLVKSKVWDKYILLGKRNGNCVVEKICNREGEVCYR